MASDSGNGAGASGAAHDEHETESEVGKAAGPSRAPVSGSTGHFVSTGSTLSDGRFRLRRRLGSGGMGVVYEAFDVAQDTLVALKTLSHVDPSSLYFLKNEFRSLADVVHPNLVALHGMFSDGDHWFVTMELIIGVSFVDFVRGFTPAFGTLAEGDTVKVAAPPRGPRIESLDNALLQLVSGVSAIHSAGKVHRDLKPSNVLVTSHGRVVILDFGLAAELTADGIGQTVQGGILGTPVFMAPEQLLGAPASAASDWYSVGVMLYQALTGDLPFEGRFHQVFAAKQGPPPRPSAKVIGIPEALDKLCVALLSPDPKDRPTGPQILERLSERTPPSSRTSSAPETATTAPRSDAPFVGRVEELGVLDAALAATEEGRSMAVLVSGPSGMGKTALVEHFLGTLRDRGNCVVLQGRCYERESVAYKALDALIDSLSRHLRRTPGSEAFLPRDIRALVRVFPVLERVESIAESPQRRALPADPQELRRRAFGALREMFGRIADRSPLVVFVDDLQWGDIDSALVMREILSPPDAPAMLFVGTCRSDERDKSPCIETLLEEPKDTTAIDWVELRVGILGDEESTELAGKLLGATAKTVDVVRREGRGSPFFITELVRYLEQRVSGDDPSSAAVLTLDRALQRRVSMLPAPAKKTLEVISVAARPLDASTIAVVSGLAGQTHAALRQLTGLKLARRVGADGSSTYTTYHDRIREAVAGRLPEDRLRAIHRSLAEALERDGSGDLDAITEHLLAAGDIARAAQYATRAAALAQAALAFDRATRLYTLAIEHGALSVERAVELRSRLGDALVDAGRGAEAAQAFIDAADRASVAEATSLRRRAAEQLILAGHLDAGLVMLRDMAGELGLELPASPADADLGSFTAFNTLTERGYDYVYRREQDIEPALLSRIDLSGSLALANLTVDTSEGMLWTLRHLLAALDAGDPRRILRALSLYAFCSGGILPTDGIVERAEALVTALGTPEARAWGHLARAAIPYWKGLFLEAAREYERAEAVLREEVHGSARELASARLMLSSALWHAEDIIRVSSHGARSLADGRERNDLYLVTWCYVRAHYTRLAEDQPGLAASEVHEALRRWGRDRVDFIAWQSALALSMIDRYEGGTGMPFITERWAEIQANPGFSTCPVHRALTRRERAFAALSLAARTLPGDEQSRLLRMAEEDAGHVVDTGVLGGAAFGELVSGAVAFIAGDRETALARVTSAFDRYSERPQYYAITAALLRRQRGRLLGGDEGARVVREAERDIIEKGVRNVERWANTFLPGFEAPRG
jgi:energy-coupling factor transporter ATP-binding protein EcfA2